VFADAGGEAVGEELDKRLQEELAFWQATAPSLSQGWWNQDATPHAPLRERYIQTWQLILALERTHYAPAIVTVKQLGNLWRTSTVSGPYSAKTYQAPVARRLLKLMSVDPRGD